MMFIGALEKDLQSLFATASHIAVGLEFCDSSESASCSEHSIQHYLIVPLHDPPAVTPPGISQ